MADERTIAYYNSHAAEYFEQTRLPSASGLIQYVEEALLPGSVLDFGFGSGRDMLLLRGMGYTVKGYDPAADLVSHVVTEFPELADDVFVTREKISPEFFDNIFVSAVFQHIPENELSETIGFLSSRMVDGGRMLWSIPVGRTDLDEQFRDPSGRIYFARPRQRYINLMKFHGLSLVQHWHDEDRLGRRDIRWNSFLMEKGDKQ